MGKEKSTARSRSKALRKTFLDDKEKQTKSKTKKSVNNNDSEYDLDSLEYMRDTTKRKKSDGIDEKIELLKTELKTLFSGKALVKNNYLTDTTNDSMSNDLVNCNSFSLIKPVTLDSELKENYEGFKHFKVKKENFKPVSSSTPSKVSIEVVEEATSEIVEEKLSDGKNTSLVNIPEKSIPQIAEPKSTAFNTSPLSQEKVELLLYESFVMQISKSNLDSEKIDSEFNVSPNKIDEKEPRKSKKKSKDCNKKYTQLTLNKYTRTTRKGRKRKLLSGNSSKSDAEIVDLESSTCSNVKAKNDTIFLDSEIIDYDWNEPFNLSNSELEVLENGDKKETPENQELTLNRSDIRETDLSGFNNEIGKTPLKKGWECPVCFEPSKGQEVVATQCGHIFCKKCLKNHFRKLGESCPSCRTNLINKPPITLFNF